ncbi:lysostaphin resistance A-like protein [Actinomadura sp. NPDC047616]|uniref:CPBP family intramembrane glutamic endopeptidase n=1 Tax=Actinomadura sp. NPDC047616 TaxID=3155914 RepID=UPI0033C464B8
MPDPADANGWAPPDDPGSSQGPPQAQPYPQPVPPPYTGPQPYGTPPSQPYGAQAQPYGAAPQAYGSPYQQPYGYPGYGYPGYGPPVKRPWTVPVPDGVPYHRMARNAVHRWWRPLVGTLTILGGALCAMLALTIVGTVVYVLATGEMPEPSQSATSFFGDSTADLTFNLAALAVLLPVVLLVPWWVQRRRPGTLSSVAGRLRWRWLLVCGGLAIGFCLVSFGTSSVAGQFAAPPNGGGEDHWVGWGEFLLPALIIIALVPFQASAEEYVFRGWLLQAVGACTLENGTGRVARALSVVFRTPWPGIVVGSALFTSGHGYTGWGILDIFVFGAVAGWVTVRTGGLEAAIAVHVFNNLMAFLLPAAVGKLDIEQGAIPWQYVVADVAPMLLYAAVVAWLARKMRIQTVTGGSDQPNASVDAPPSTGVPGATVGSVPGAPSGHAVPGGHGVPGEQGVPGGHGFPAGGGQGVPGWPGAPGS